MISLEESYAYCRRVARREARNFYYSFVLLPRAQNDAMCAVYAFMRYCDDLSDGNAGASAESMNNWRQDLDRALAGDYGLHPCWPAFHDTVRRYGIPARYFHSMIDGVTSDLVPRDIQTFEELYLYCYQVASVVGLTITHIFGFDDPRALVYAEKCGIAFQLTNIIRDVREDAERGRNYLPREDRERFSDLRDLLEFEAGRARAYYTESSPLVSLVHKDSRRSLWALIEIYRRLLERIASRNYDVMTTRVRLSTFEKSAIVLQALTKRL